MRFLPRLTTLEDRCTPATTTWAPVGISEDGSAGANWTNGVPGNGDTAIIPDNTNPCDLSELNVSLAKLDVQCDGIGSRQAVTVGTLRAGELDADFTDFYITTRLEPYGLGVSNLESCDFYTGPGAGELLVSGTGETFADDCIYMGPVTVTGTLVVTGDYNQADLNWSVSGTLDLRNGAVLDNVAGGSTITVSGLLTSSVTAGGGQRNEIGSKVVITSAGTLRLDAAPATGAGLEVGTRATSGYSLVVNGTAELYGGNVLVADEREISFGSGSTLKVYPRETESSWHGVGVYGHGDLSSCAVTFMDGTAGQAGRGVLAWYGNVTMTGTTVTMTKNWTTGAYNHWQIDGTMTLTGSNTFAMSNVALPTTPPAASGQILFIDATGITNDFTTYTIDGRFLHDVYTTTGGKAIRVYWTAQSWPGNE